MSIPYLCPICQKTLFKSGNGYRCSANHCFDIAKEGYVNLLPVQKKKSKDPGDNKTMVQARAKFLEGNYYQAFADKIVDSLRANKSNISSLLDIGCGTGWYTEQVFQELGKPFIHGIDISKHAVRLAAKSNKDICYSVASAYSLPFPNDSFDAAVCIFSPIDLKELKRVLKPGGIFVFAEPGPSHLQELAALVYDKVQPHRGNEEGTSSVSELQLLSTEPCQHECEVKSEDIGSLLAMTPYYWTVSEEKKKKIEELESLTVQLDFKISCMVKPL